LPEIAVNRTTAMDKLQVGIYFRFLGKRAGKLVSRKNESLLNTFSPSTMKDFPFL